MSIHYRNVLPEDAKAFYDCMKQLDVETKFMLYTPTERTFDLTKVEQMINRVTQNGFLWAAWQEGKIVGYILVDVTNLQKVRHLGYLVLGVLQEVSRQGIGTALLNAAIVWAKNCSLHRLEMTVMEENLPARALYQKLGFVEEGYRQDAIWQENHFVSEFYLARIL